MFKKPLGNLKTCAPLRGSERRKFKQRVIACFAVSSDEGDLLVPEGIQSVKFSTHLNEQGVAYLAPEGDPLWLTIGKGSDELIPTIYTLWKKRDLLPFVSTPPSVIPVLVGGADLMIPGVIYRPPSMAQGQLVAVRQLDRKEEKPTLSAPLAVGRMAIPSDQITEDGRGKAVLVLHTWKDYLWEMGSRGDPPEPMADGASQEGEKQEENANQENGQVGCNNATKEANPEEQQPLPLTVSYLPQEVTDILQKSLLQAISTVPAPLPPSSFPIPATQFYTNYILPSRPAHPSLLFPPPSLIPLDLSKDQVKSLINPNDITIKTSNHKSLTNFLRAAEKASLLTLKSPQKHSHQTDLLVMSVNMSHPNVTGHVGYETMKQAEEKAAKRAKREEMEQAGSQGGKSELGVRLLWKPHVDSIPLFEGMGADTKILYTMQEIKTLLNSYVSSENLVNQNDQAYINLDDLLSECVYAKRPQKSKKQGKENEESTLLGEFMKREELTKKVTEKMQGWYEIARNGEVVQKKGALKPVQVITKVRQGRKTSTYITGFEPFILVGAEVIADELRRLCASATSVSPIAGKQNGMEVLIQGNQSKAAFDYLISSRVPKGWIEVHGKR